MSSVSTRDLMDAYFYGSKFKMEYDSLWATYDNPIHTVEKDNKKIMLYELIGLNKEHIKVETEFINKTKTTYLNITGEFVDELTGWKNEINIHERIDTDIYCGYETNIKDGILTVVLYETINHKPAFDDRGRV